VAGVEYELATDAATVAEECGAIASSRDWQRHSALRLRLERARPSDAARVWAIQRAAFEEYLGIQFQRLRALSELKIDFVIPPTTMTWGNRSIYFRDPDGNLVNLFSHVASG